MKKSIHKKPLKILIGLSLILSLNSAQANGWFGNNNNFFNRYSGSNSYNDWPVWTPMYWMQEMLGNNYNNRYYGNNGRYPGVYGNPYQANFYGYRAYPDFYSHPYYSGQANYLNNAYGGYYPQAQYPFNQYQQYRQYQNQYYLPQTSSAMNPFGMSASGMNRSNPFSGFSGFNSGGNNFGRSLPYYGGMPMNNYGTAFNNPFNSPFSYPMNGGFPSSYGSPMSGYGSPFMPGASMMPGSTMGMGMPGMSPMSGFGGSPFSASGFTPFR